MYNTTASGIDTNKIKQHRSSTINMRYFFIRDQKTLKRFLAAWKAGHNYEKHHKHLYSIYLQTNKMSRSVLLVLLKPDLQGCVDLADSKMNEFRKKFPIP